MLSLFLFLSGPSESDKSCDFLLASDVLIIILEMFLRIVCLCASAGEQTA